MSISKEVLADLQEKYVKVIKLLEEDSKLDPVNEPYLSKYQAHQILVGMEASIDNLLKNYDKNSKEHISLSAMLGAVYLYLGMVSIDTQELSIGEKHLEKCNKMIEDHYHKPGVVMVSLFMFNQFGILWSQREPSKAKIYLEKAEQLYIDFKKSNQIPLDISDMFESNIAEYNEIKARMNFEKVHTLTLYYLAQIYGALGDAMKSSLYCHITLQRQLETNDYEPIDWALNSATLSQFFMEKNGFKQARHHLSASLYILSQYKKTLDNSPHRGEVFEAKMEQYNHRSADVARCWIKYGILLLAKSRDRLLSHTEDTDEVCKLTTDLSKMDLNSDSTVSIDDLKNLDYKGINLSEYEKEVTDQFVLTIEDARKVFLSVQKWIIKAQSYYTLENLASDFIEITQDQSQLYLNLLFFEEDPENQAKLHKRRIDLLENILTKVNSQYYLQYCKEIWRELAQTYADMLEIKIMKLRESKERPKPQALTKINFLIDKSIGHYKNFIGSFKEPNGKPLKKIDDIDEKAYILAHCHMAALHSRYITLNKSNQISNEEQSLKCYQFIIDYCKENEKAKTLIPTELGLCNQMITILPLKINKMKQDVK